MMDIGLAQKGGPKRFGCVRRMYYAQKLVKFDVVNRESEHL